jgi:hypothetical protein
MLRRVALLALLIGCRGSTAAQVDGASGDTGPADTSGDARAADGGSADSDGAPMRQPCTSTFGAALSASTYGRLDGYLVAIVVPGPSSGPCNADLGHVHLQIVMGGAVYDVAVNVGTNDATNDVHTTTLEHALIGPAWAEGWHTDVSVDYVALGVHANTLPLQTENESVAALMTDLATANHVSIYATGYSPVPSGAHLVHRNSGVTDGLVVTQPLSPMAHARLFSFTNQTF